jgi:hypothetical protein
MLFALSTVIHLWQSRSQTSNPNVHVKTELDKRKDCRTKTMPSIKDGNDCHEKFFPLRLSPIDPTTNI